MGAWKCWSAAPQLTPGGVCCGAKIECPPQRRCFFLDAASTICFVFPGSLVLNSPAPNDQNELFRCISPKGGQLYVDLVIWAVAPGRGALYKVTPAGVRQRALTFHYLTWSRGGACAFPPPLPPAFPSPRATAWPTRQTAYDGAAQTGGPRSGAACCAALAPRQQRQSPFPPPSPPRRALPALQPSCSTLCRKTVWHLNVHYSRSLTELAAFLPVLLSAGGAAGRQFAVAVAVWCVRELPARRPTGQPSQGVQRRRAPAQREQGLWGVGGQAARRGVAAVSVVFTKSAVACSFRPLLASSRRDANRTRRTQSGAR
eukprot:gene24199-biopygen8923